MATVNYLADETAQEVTEAGTDKDFILQNKSGAVDLLASFGTTAGEWFVVEAGGTLIRAGVDGKLWIKSSDPLRTANVVIAAGA